MRRFKRIHHAAITIIYLSLIAASSRANADSLKRRGMEIAVAIAGTGIAIGVVIGLAIHAGKSNGLEGCTMATPAGLELHQFNSSETWVLLGDTTLLKPGQHVRLSGKRQKKTDATTRDFTVEKVKKVFGSCP